METEMVLTNPRREMEDNGGTAFPVPESYGTRLGMSLRDWFAGQALVGLCAYDETPEGLARASYQVADAMLKARDTTNE
jgi:hypothetical protein